MSVIDVCKAIALPVPSVNIIMKKRAEKNCGTTENRESASGYDINASPEPPRTTFEISFVPISCAKLPRIPKIVQPAIRLVKVSSVVIIIMSLIKSIRNYFLSVITKETKVYNL